MDDSEELRARIEAQMATRRTSAPSSTPDDNGDTPDEQSEDGPRQLTPIRPWLLQGPKPAEAKPAATAASEPSAPRAESESGLEPTRPWLKREAPPAPKAAPATPVEPSGRSRVLDPTRPWLKRPIASGPAHDPVTPTPSNPESVLEPLAAELEAAALAAAAGKRRLFGRRRPSPQSVVEDTVRPAEKEPPKHAAAPGQPSWPISFESSELADSSVAMLGPAPAGSPWLAGADEAPPPATVHEDDAVHAGRLRRAANWLLEQAPEQAPVTSSAAADETPAAPAAPAEPIAEPAAEAAAEVASDSAPVPETMAPVDAEPMAEVAATADAHPPGKDLARRLSATGPVAAVPEEAEPRPRLARLRRRAEPEPEPIAEATPATDSEPAPLRPTIAWDKLRKHAPVAEPVAEAVAEEPAADPSAEEPIEEPLAEPVPAKAEVEAVASVASAPAATPAPAPTSAPKPPAAAPAGPRPRPRPYASAPIRTDEPAAPPAPKSTADPYRVSRGLSGQANATRPSIALKVPDEPPTKLVKGGPEGPGRNLRWLVRTGIMLAIAVLAAVLLRVYVVAPYYIPSASMEPTLHGCSGCNNDHVLVDKLSYRMHDVHRGDVVVFNRPSNWQVSEKTLIKRVIGLPGDTLRVSDGKLFVNGLQLDESYLNSKCSPMKTLAESPASSSATFGPVPANEVYVMGDNRCDSSDSRAFGPVAESKIVGRAFVIIWPLGRIHYL